jgi:hypothetical protein
LLAPFYLIEEAKEMIQALNMSQMVSLPKLYETQDMPFPERVVQMHFVRENGEWFAVEYDPEERLFYGYIDVRPGPPQWGYFGLDEIMDCWIPSLCPEADLDLDWKPKIAKEIPGILGGE